MKTTKIAEFKHFQEVRDFLSALSKEFPLTNFNPVLNLLNLSFYNQDICLVIEEENNPGSISNLDLKLKGSALAHGGGYSAEYYRAALSFHWDTSSGHIVEIHGDIHDVNGDGEFSVSIGTDESECFYPTVKSIVKKEEI